jgi:hypothetical protein
MPLVRSCPALVKLVTEALERTYGALIDPNGSESGSKQKQHRPHAA